MIARAALLFAVWLAPAALAAPMLTHGTLREFNVELPDELRTMAGRGKLSHVAHALVTVAVPTGIDVGRDTPLLVVSATSEPGYQSSRHLLRDYADAATSAGWMIVAADPAEGVAFDQDGVPMRLALNTAALAVVSREWPDAAKAPLAFGGFSGGAKYSGWLAAAFASQRRAVIGIYLAGINQNTVIDGATQFGVLDGAFRRIPVFLQVGDQDDIATPTDHRTLASELRHAGFKNVRVESFVGKHEVEAELLHTAPLCRCTPHRPRPRTDSKKRRWSAPCSSCGRELNTSPTAPRAAPHSTRRDCRSPAS